MAIEGRCDGSAVQLEEYFFVPEVERRSMGKRWLAMPEQLGDRCRECGEKWEEHEPALPEVLIGFLFAWGERLRHRMRNMARGPYRLRGSLSAWNFDLCSCDVAPAGTKGEELEDLVGPYFRGELD